MRGRGEEEEEEEDDKVPLIPPAISDFENFKEI